MRFWDSSAISPLTISESASERMAHLYRQDPSQVVWWATLVECTSSIARREREALGPGVVREALSVLNAFASAWIEVEPRAEIRSFALRLLRSHALRAADSLQLAAAIWVSEQRPESLPFVTLDERLAVAAEREGFPVIGL
jgi:uncharacterized protein